MNETRQVWEYLIREPKKKKKNAILQQFFPNPLIRKKKKKKKKTTKVKTDRNIETRTLIDKRVQVHETSAPK